jgi:hypothetical protein
MIKTQTYTMKSITQLDDMAAGFYRRSYQWVFLNSILGCAVMILSIGLASV